MWNADMQWKNSSAGGKYKLCPPIAKLLYQQADDPAPSSHGRKFRKSGLPDQAFSDNKAPKSFCTAGWRVKNCFVEVLRRSSESIKDKPKQIKPSSWSLVFDIKEMNERLCSKIITDLQDRVSIELFGYQLYAWSGCGLSVLRGVFNRCHRSLPFLYRGTSRSQDTQRLKQRQYYWHGIKQTPGFFVCETLKSRSCPMSTVPEYPSLPDPVLFLLLFPCGNNHRGWQNCLPIMSQNANPADDLLLPAIVCATLMEKNLKMILPLLGSLLTDK